jgi:hypothetical protein
MYYYLYDTFVADRRHEALLSQVEARLADLGISGKVGRMTPFTNPRELVRDEMKAGTKTIVVVGSDETLLKVLDGFSGSGVALGYIPMGGPDHLAKSFGIPAGEGACDVLSKRVVHELDLGRVNGQAFLSHVVVPPGKYAVEGEGKFRMTPITVECGVVVANLPTVTEVGKGNEVRVDGDPKDGSLDVLVTSSQDGFWKRLVRSVRPNASVLRLSRLVVSGRGQVTGYADGGRRVASDRLVFDVAPKALRVIVGKDRGFK